MTLKWTKTYKNGATHAFICNVRREDEYKAKVDAEDRDAGLFGVWSYEIRKVY